jgi:hypothetical protein
MRGKPGKVVDRVPTDSDEIGRAGLYAAVYEISDRPAVAAAVSRLVALVGGSETVAASTIGLSQATINRLRNQAKPGITHRTARKLEQAAKRLGGESLQRELSEAIMSPVALRLLNDGYRAWCEERIRRFAARSGPTWKSDESGQPRAAEFINPDHAVIDRTQFLGWLLKLVKDDVGGPIAEFERWMGRRGVDPRRQFLAVRRIIEPIAESSQSAYIERRWSELDMREKRDFIDHGIAREKILLTREHGHTRALRIARAGATALAGQRRTR